MPRLKEIIIPHGIKKISDHHLCNGVVENVMVSASVREIGARAFYNCKNLKRITFMQRSKLARIGSGCFYKTRIEKIVIPKGVEEI